MNWIFIKAALQSAPCVVFLLELGILWLTLRPKGGRLLAVVAFGLVAANKFFVFELFGGDAFNPELSRWIIVLWGWMESVIWVTLPATVLALLIAGAVRPFRRFAFRTVLLSSLVLAAYGVWEGLRVPPVVEYEVAIEGLPPEFDGYRIAHLSDLHCSSVARRDKIASIVERTNSAYPDLVAITGDLVDGLPRARASDLEPLQDLRATDGVVACTGNHEAYSELDRWEPFYRRWGVRLLRNEWISIVRGPSALAIGGEDDRMFGRGASEKTRLGAPAEGCRILLRHRPIWSDYSESQMHVRLQLSGHTHGGVMPVLSKLVAAGKHGYVRGFYREGRMLLHVSPGTGQWAGFPLRFFNPPEITILILRRDC